MPNRFQTLIAHLAEGVEREYHAARQHARDRDIQRSGHAGESTWARLLEEWGPGWPVATRKYIVGPGGDSNEVDLVLLKPDYPTQLAGEASVLVSGVAAAFSCKLTLDRGGLREALDQKRLLHEVAGSPNSSAQEALCGPFPFGVLAHSSSLTPRADEWDEMMVAAYEEVAHASANPMVTEPAAELDALLVADRGFFHTRRVALSPPPGGESSGAWAPMSSFNRSARLDHPGAPLAQFIAWIHAKCGGTSLRTLSEMFRAEEGQGYTTHWPIEVYPEHIRSGAERTLLNEFGNPLLF